MANHGFVTTKNPLTTDRLEILVRKISQDRFAGAMMISRNGKYVVVEKGLLLWLASSRKVEIRDQIRGEYGRWIDSVVTNDLSLALDGMISCQGIQDKWKGKDGLYPTLRSYIDAIRGSMNMVGSSIFLGFDQLELEKLMRACDEREFAAVENEAMRPYLGR